MTTINLISNLSEESNLQQLDRFNTVVAWFLRKAFEKQGVNCNFVMDYRNILHRPMPQTDHSIVTSGTAMWLMRTHPLIRKKIRKATKGKVTVYLDNAYSQWFPYFDYLFTVVEPTKTKPKKCVYAGWGADPKWCFPEQKEKTVFVDQNVSRRGAREAHLWSIYQQVLPKTGLKIIHHPKPRIPWVKMQSQILRKTHYFCVAGAGESGLNRIEAATCGALLVIPYSWRPRVLASLECARFKTNKELIEILKTPTNPKAIRKKALKHTWDKVASRILKTLCP